MERNVTRDSVLALILEKENIEAEISQMKSVLDGVSFVFDVSVCRQQREKHVMFAKYCVLY
jgi:hypothetical protein